MKDCNCKIRFEAEDGTLFNTRKECEEYESRPHVWVARNSSDIFSLFLTKKEAELFKLGLIESNEDFKYLLNE